MRWGPGCRERMVGWDPNVVGLAPQGCYEKVKMWFDDNKHVLGTVGMCILIMQVRGASPAASPTLLASAQREGSTGK